MATKSRVSLGIPSLGSLVEEEGEKDENVAELYTKLRPLSRKSLPTNLGRTRTPPHVTSPTSASDNAAGRSSKTSGDLDRTAKPLRRMSLAVYSSEDARRIANRDLLKCPSVSRRRASLTYLEATTQLRKEDVEDIQHPKELQRRLSFQTVGSQISTLLRAKKMFGKFREHKVIEDKEDETAFEIKEMPKAPRFASKLSAEAQYAMMKGYEDVVYGQICKSNPEYRPMLRRNRTPSHGVMMSPRLYNGPRDELEDPDFIDGRQELDEDDAALENSGDFSDTKTVLSDNSLTSDGKTKPGELASSRNKHRRSVDTGDKSHEGWNGRLPHMLPKEKQLVLTYRYQSAMDILDHVRKGSGAHVLSPRLKRCKNKGKNAQTVPVKDFNSWSYVWRHEFEPKPEVANQRQA